MISVLWCRCSLGVSVEQARIYLGLATIIGAAFSLSSCSQDNAIVQASDPVEAPQDRSLDHVSPKGGAALHGVRSPVPGGCTALASDNVGQPGCYMAGEITIENPPALLYWNVYYFNDAAAAAEAVSLYPWSFTTQSHGRHWAHVIAPTKVRLSEGKRAAAVGPMNLDAGKTVRARFLESYFPPGMQTSVHSHPGPEGFYVIDGVQCMETPAGKQKLRAGDTMIVPARRTHFQAAPTGRRNIAVVFYPPGEPWMRMEQGWAPSKYCHR